MLLRASETPRTHHGSRLLLIVPCQVLGCWGLKCLLWRLALFRNRLHLANVHAPSYSISMAILGCAERDAAAKVLRSEVRWFLSRAHDCEGACFTLTTAHADYLLTGICNESAVVHKILLRTRYSLVKLIELAFHL